MRNATNAIKYKLYAPVYDKVIGNRLFTEARKKALSKLSFQDNSNVLIAGVGTGQDLPFLPANINITGIDISEEMLKKARSKAGNRNVTFIKMNAEKLELEDEAFDFVILNLVLSVVENPQKALLEAARVLSPNGIILVFDKFLDDHKNPSLFRKVVNGLTTTIATDINRRFCDILGDMPLRMASNEGSIFNGNFRIIVLEKKKV